MEKNNQLKELKEKIKFFSYNKFSYRIDLNKIEYKEQSDDCNLYFDIWQKTAGEQYGNCSGRKIKISIGNKYIKISGIFYSTNQPEMKLKDYYINKEDLEFIVNNLEQADKEENEVDKDYIIIKVIKKLYRQYYE